MNGFSYYPNFEDLLDPRGPWVALGPVLGGYPGDPYSLVEYLPIGRERSWEYPGIQDKTQVISRRKKPQRRLLPGAPGKTSYSAVRVRGSNDNRAVFATADDFIVAASGIRYFLTSRCPPEQYRLGLYAFGGGGRRRNVSHSRVGTWCESVEHRSSHST